MSLKEVRLSNGNLMPLIGIGTGGKRCDEMTTKAMLRIALEDGYRHIDTAITYGTEDLVGEVLENFIQEGKLRREDVFITTKLSPNNHRKELVRAALMNSLERLRTSYVDMFLIHTPMALKSKGPIEMSMFELDQYEFDIETDLIETWHEMEKLYEEGLAKAIGVSNFNQEQLQRISDQAIKVKPMNNQVELHVHFAQKELRDYCKSHQIIMTAFAPIGCPGKRSDPNLHWPSQGPTEDPIVLKIAEKHQKTPAQILLRHLFQHGIVSIPKSTNEGRIRENIKIFDFELTHHQMEELDSIPDRSRFYPLLYGFDHPEYPFDDVTSKTG